MEQRDKFDDMLQRYRESFAGAAKRTKESTAAKWFDDSAE